MTNPLHESNRLRWQAASKGWAHGADMRGIWPRCPSEPELVLSPRELSHLEDIKDKSACVLGSGDNQVVFALAGMGAKVTSVDISQNQLDVAAERAQKLGLSIDFVQSDVSDLSSLKNESFDFIYTGGHIAVWVSDLNRFYAEAGNITKAGGKILVDEYHPFRRVWKELPDALVVETSYYERGPHEYESDQNILNKSSGSFVSYEFHWTMADYLNAVLKAGFRIVEVDEHGSDVANWEAAPMQGLPEYLMICGIKEQP